MPRTDEPRWEDYEKMIAKRAWHFSSRYNIDVEELKSEGNLVFVKALRGFDASRATFSTYLWRCLTTELNRFCRRERRQTCYELSADGEPVEAAGRDHVVITQSIHLRQSLAALPDCGYRTMLYLSQTPDMLGLTMIESPRQIQAAMRRHLRATGNTWSVVKGTMHAIKQLHAEVM